jgi:hypothetical protein
MLDWLKANVEWVFSGIGVAVLGGAFAYLKAKGGSPHTPSLTSPYINIHNVNTIDAGNSEHDTEPEAPQEDHSEPNKSDIRILFVDDDTRFRVVKIIKNSGWPHVKIVRDIAKLDGPEILEANIFFIDIQGVGKALQFSDEGLGLALAIKKRHPNKKVVIYSAQTTGTRFHAALREADYSLAKNAEPYEFIQLVENLAREINE